MVNVNGYVIHHPEDGVYIGRFWGTDFWSKIDAVYQPAAITFKSIDEAKKFMATLNSDVPENISFIEVVIDDGDRYASMQSCMNAGIEAWEI